MPPRRRRTAAKPPVQVKVVLTNEHAVLPKRATLGSAGYDLVSPAEFFIPAGKVVTIPLGLRIGIPAGHYGRISDRSSVAKGGLSVVGGVIDSDYTGEVGVMLWNHSDSNGIITKGMRIAQLVVEAIHTAPMVKVDSLDLTERGDGGYGSTGV